MAQETSGTARYDAVVRTIRVWDKDRRGLSVLEVHSFLRTATFADDLEAEQFARDLAALLTDASESGKLVLPVMRDWGERGQ